MSAQPSTSNGISRNYQDYEIYVRQMETLFTKEQENLYKEIVEQGEKEFIVANFIIDGGLSLEEYVEKVLTKANKYDVDYRKFIKWINIKMHAIHESQLLINSQSSVSHHSQSFVDLTQTEGRKERDVNTNDFTQSSMNSDRSMDRVNVERPLTMNPPANNSQLSLRRIQGLFVKKHGATLVMNSRDIHCHLDSDQRKLQRVRVLDGRAVDNNQGFVDNNQGFRSEKRVMQNVSQSSRSSQPPLASARSGLRPIFKPQVLDVLNQLGDKRSSRSSQVTIRKGNNKPDSQNRSANSQKPRRLSKNSSSRSLSRSSSRSNSQLDIRQFLGESSTSANRRGSSKSFGDKRSISSSNATSQRRDSSSSFLSKRRDSSCAAVMRRDTSSGSVHRPEISNIHNVRRDSSSSNFPTVTIRDDNVKPTREFDKEEAARLLKINRHWTHISKDLKDTLEMKILRRKTVSKEELSLRLSFYMNSAQSNMSRPGEEFDRHMRYPVGSLLRALIAMDVCGVISTVEKKLKCFTPEQLLETEFYGGLTGELKNRMPKHRAKYAGVEMIKLAETKTRETAVMFEFVVIGYLRQLEASGRIKRCFNSTGGYDTPSSCDGENKVYLLFCPDATKAPTPATLRHSKNFRHLRTDGKVYNISTSEVIVGDSKNVSKVMFNTGDDALMCKFGRCNTWFDSEAEVLFHRLTVHEKYSDIKLMCQACPFTGKIADVLKHMNNVHKRCLMKFVRDCVADRAASSQPMDIDC